MTSVWFWSLAIGLLILGALFLFAGYGGVGPYRRIRRERTRKISEIEPGINEIRASLRAVDQRLTTVDGQGAVAVQYLVEYRTSITDDDGTTVAIGNFQSDQEVPAVLVDSSGECAVDLKEMLLVASPTKIEVAPEQLAASHPDLWKLLVSQSKREQFLGLWVHQRALYEGRQYLISGEAIADTGLTPGTDYRTSRQRMKLYGLPHRPLILTDASEPELLRYLLRPTLLLVGSGLLCWGVAAGLLVGWWMIASASGI